MANCSVCSNPILRKMIDSSLEDGVSGAGVSRYLAEAGATVSAETVNRHKLHYAPPAERPKGTRKLDFAAIVRDKAAEQFESGELDLSDKNLVPGITAGLKAQAIMDGREKMKSKQANAQLAFAIIQMLSGAVEPLQLDDGLTVEGEYEELDAPD